MRNTANYTLCLEYDNHMLAAVDNMPSDMLAYGNLCLLQLYNKIRGLLIIRMFGTGTMNGFIEPNKNRNGFCINNNDADRYEVDDAGEIYSELIPELGTGIYCDSDFWEVKTIQGMPRYSEDDDWELSGLCVSSKEFEETFNEVVFGSSHYFETKEIGVIDSVYGLTDKYCELFSVENDLKLILVSSKKAQALYQFLKSLSCYPEEFCEEIKEFISLYEDRIYPYASCKGFGKRTVDDTVYYVQTIGFCNQWMNQPGEFSASLLFYYMQMLSVKLFKGLNPKYQFYKEAG